VAKDVLGAAAAATPLTAGDSTRLKVRSDVD
jgi:hypothetical protein